MAGGVSGIYRATIKFRAVNKLALNGVSFKRRKRKKVARKTQQAHKKKSTVKRKTIRSNVKDLHFLSERFDETAIRVKIGDGPKVVDRVRYVKKTESSDVRTGTYELQARCNGVWLRVFELIAVGQLDKAIWGHFAGLIGKEQCQTGVLELMKFYKLSVPSSVVLSAARAKARITSGSFKLKGVRR